MTKDLEKRIAEGITKDDENLQHWLTLQERIIKSKRYLDEYRRLGYRLKDKK